jgi:hypothetical protein
LKKKSDDLEDKNKLLENACKEKIKLEKDIEDLKVVLSLQTKRFN